MLSDKSYNFGIRYQPIQKCAIFQNRRFSAKFLGIFYVKFMFHVEHLCALNIRKKFPKPPFLPFEKCDFTAFSLKTAQFSYIFQQANFSGRIPLSVCKSNAFFSLFFLRSIWNIALLRAFSARESEQTRIRPCQLHFIGKPQRGAPESRFRSSLLVPRLAMSPSRYTLILAPPRYRLSVPTRPASDGAFGFSSLSFVFFYPR